MAWLSGRRQAREVSETGQMHLGTRQEEIVKVDYPEPDLRFNLDHGTAGEYDGMDPFGRVVDLLWRDYGSSSDAVRIGRKKGEKKGDITNSDAGRRTG